MKTIDYLEGRIPTYALSYLINADATGLEDEDRANVDRWHKECTEKLTSMYPDADLLFVIRDDEGANFETRPVFGLACDCVDGAFLVLVSNDDKRPECKPDWMI